MQKPSEPSAVLTVGKLRTFLSALSPEADDTPISLNVSLPVCLEVSRREVACLSFLWRPFAPQGPTLTFQDKPLRGGDAKP